MANYTPQQGLFVNGRIADATEVLNEFTAISVAIKQVTDEAEDAGAKALQDAKTHTDNKLAAFNVDGGTF